MRVLTVVLCAALLAACGSSNDADDANTGTTAIESTGGKVTLGVNSYLWHASLDTLSFMPLASADPFGGVIITDWYSAPDAPNERLKVTIYILDRSLRADGLKIAVFRQTAWRRLGRRRRSTPTRRTQARRCDPDARPRASPRDRRLGQASVQSAVRPARFGLPRQRGSERRSMMARYNAKESEKTLAGGLGRAQRFRHAERFRHGPNAMCWRCSPIRRGASIWAMCATTRWAMCIARFRRAQGFNVLHPMGWDAFGLPAENAARDKGVNPRDWTYANIAAMREQLKTMGLSIDWTPRIRHLRSGLLSPAAEAVPGFLSRPVSSIAAKPM